MTYVVYTLAACTDNLDGMVHSHGDSWNPVHPEFGRVECILCTCTVSLHATHYHAQLVSFIATLALYIQNGSIHCAQEPCPEVPLCGPNEPFPDVVICCLKCKPSEWFLWYELVGGQLSVIDLRDCLQLVLLACVLRNMRYRYFYHSPDILNF